MAIEIPTNTALYIPVGPFLDKADGITPELSITVANSAITLIAGASDETAPTVVLDSVAGNNATNTLVHITGDDAGMHYLKLTAANNNRYGKGMLIIEDTDTYVTVFHEIQWVSAAYYAWKYGTTKPEMNLADDAITAAKFDESTAFPLKSADTGSTAVARTGADSDTLETLSDQIDLVPASTGSLTFNATCATDLKTGVALSATGADLILKNSTFIQAIVAAINEFATYGLTALNTLLVNTGIKASSIPDVQLAASQDHITPSQAGDKMDLIDAPNGTAVTAIQNGLSTFDSTSDGVTLTTGGIDAIFDRNSSLSISFETLINRIYQMINDKMEITNESGDVVLRNIADSADIATGNVSDDSTTTTRDGLTWV